MKVRIPSKTVEVCDLCKGNAGCAPLETCIVCGKEYCWSCEGIMAGCMHQPKVCKVCAKDDAVQDVVERFASRIARVVANRTTALTAIRKG